MAKHEHTCRRCGSGIDCDLDGCDLARPHFLAAWEGDNVGCPNEEAENAAKIESKMSDVIRLAAGGDFVVLVTDAKPEGFQWIFAPTSGEVVMSEERATAIATVLRTAPKDRADSVVAAEVVEWFTPGEELAWVMEQVGENEEEE